jgi:hypothetical protein
MTTEAPGINRSLEATFTKVRETPHHV